jgi:hemin uptake protein HemP
MDEVRPLLPAPGSAEEGDARTLHVRSEELLRGSRELVIEHRGQQYRLLRTRNDRLILNK